MRLQGSCLRRSSYTRFLLIRGFRVHSRLFHLICVHLRLSNRCAKAVYDLWKNGPKLSQIRVDSACGHRRQSPGMFFYLAGSIEYSSFGHEVYDPAEDEKKSLTETEVSDFRSW